jgi:predicted ATPase
MIEGIEIKGFKCLGDIAMGKLWRQPHEKSLTPVTVIIGGNGTGKTVFFDALDFISDCFIYGAIEACRMKGRKGFNSIATPGQTNISFEICWRKNRNKTPQSYIFDIALNNKGLPHFLWESLYQWPKRERSKPSSENFIHIDGYGPKGEALLVAENGMGQMETGAKGIPLTFKRFRIEEHQLALAAFMNFRENFRMIPFARFLKSWHLSRFRPSASRSLQDPRKFQHMNERDCNLGSNIAWMMENNEKRTQLMLQRIASKLPGIKEVIFKKAETYPVILFKRENDVSFSHLDKMSDGQIRLFYYLLLMESGCPFFCIDEIETSLHGGSLPVLGRELRRHTIGKQKGYQCFFTTNSPFLLNDFAPKEVWILNTSKSGKTKMKRTSSFLSVERLSAEGLGLGQLWENGYLD